VAEAFQLTAPEISGVMAGADHALRGPLWLTGRGTGNEAEHGVDNPVAVLGSAPVGQQSADEVGRVEARGIEIVAEGDRRSQPSDLAWAMFGPQFGLGNMVFGSLGIVFGLSWWSTFTAVTVGVTLGSLIFAGVAIQSPKTGTNNAVSSGAFFGVTGRYLGALISLFIGLAFFAILVWTSGQTIIDVFHRILGSGTGNVALSIAMLVVSLISFVLAIYGHATLVASFRWIGIVSAGVSLLAFIVLAGEFHAVHRGSYALGEYWPTWVLTMVLAALLPVTWGPVIGDYGRYIPTKTKASTCALAAGAGHLRRLLAGRDHRRLRHHDIQRSEDRLRGRLPGRVAAVVRDPADDRSWGAGEYRERRNVRLQRRARRARHVLASQPRAAHARDQRDRARRCVHCADRVQRDRLDRGVRDADARHGQPLDGDHDRRSPDAPWAIRADGSYFALVKIFPERDARHGAARGGDPSPLWRD
jgi:hypothetical protein